MAAMNMVLVTVLFLALTTLGSTLDPNDCDCQCLLKECIKHSETEEQKARCNTGLDLCVKCGTKECNIEAAKCHNAATTPKEMQTCISNWFKCAQCMCKDKICRKHVESHHEADHCGQSLAICRNCDTTECNKEQEVCMKGVKTHEDLHKCINAWHKCGQCHCGYDRCKKHQETHHPGSKGRCMEGLNLCRKCETEKCDEENSKCLSQVKSDEDLHKCIDGWYACVKKDCHAQTPFYLW